MKKLEYIPLYFSYLFSMEELTDAQFGCVLRQALHYAAGEQTRKLTGVEALALRFLTLDIDRAQSNYAKLVQERSEAGRKGAASRWQGKQANDGNDGNSNSNSNSESNSNSNSNSEADACAVQQSSTVPPLPLLGGKLYCVSLQELEELKGLYPAVDVEQALRTMRGWCLSNPKKCKTARGIQAFIHRWLAKEQDERPRAVSKPDRSAMYQQHGELSPAGKAAIAEMLAWGEANGIGSEDEATEEVRE